MLVLQARPSLTQALEEGNFDNLVDPRLQGNYNANEMAKMVACASACVQQMPFRRPRMSQVTLMHQSLSYIVKYKFRQHNKL